jgi:hypothetical protein
MFQSIEAVIERFQGQRYICNRTIATVVYLASPPAETHSGRRTRWRR